MNKSVKGTSGKPLILLSYKSIGKLISWKNVIDCSPFENLCTNANRVRNSKKLKEKPINKKGGGVINKYGMLMVELCHRERWHMSWKGKGRWCKALTCVLVLDIAFIGGLLDGV